MPVQTPFSAFAPVPDLVGARRGVVADQQRQIEAAMDWQNKRAAIAQAAQRLAQEKQIADMKMLVDQQQNERTYELHRAQLDYTKAYQDQTLDMHAKQLQLDWLKAEAQVDYQNRMASVDERNAAIKEADQDFEFGSNQEYRRRVAAGEDPRKVVLDMGPRASLPASFNAALEPRVTKLDQAELIDFQDRARKILALQEAHSKDELGKGAYVKFNRPDKPPLSPREQDRLKAYLDDAQEIKRLEAIQNEWRKAQDVSTKDFSVVPPPASFSGDKFIPPPPAFTNRLSGATVRRIR